MTFENDIDKLIGYAKLIIKQKSLRINPEDLVNDVYIQHFESGKNYYINDIKKLIVVQAFKELGHQSSVTDYTDWEKKKIVTTESYCKCCEETKPISAFYLRYEYGQYRVFCDCKECWNKKSLEYIRNNKEKHRESYRKYFLNNTEKERERKRKLEAEKRANDPEYLAKCRESSRRCYYANKERQRQKKQTYQMKLEKAS